MVLDIDGDLYCVYHARTTETGDDRVVFIDRMQIKDGILTVDGPTTQPFSVTLK